MFHPVARISKFMAYVHTYTSILYIKCFFHNFQFKAYPYANFQETKPLNNNPFNIDTLLDKFVANLT